MTLAIDKDNDLLSKHEKDRIKVRGLEKDALAIIAHQKLLRGEKTPFKTFCRINIFFFFSSLNFM